LVYISEAFFVGIFRGKIRKNTISVLETEIVAERIYYNNNHKCCNYMTHAELYAGAVSLVVLYL